MHNTSIAILNQHSVFKHIMDTEYHLMTIDAYIKSLAKLE